MKNMNMKERYWTMNLQVFAGDDDDPGDEGGDDDNDDPGDDDDDSDDDDEPEENEKKFSQKDVDDAVKKRLAREKRKWQREQQKKAGKKPNGKVKTGESSEKEDDDTETQELRDKAAKADEMEMKWTCLEHDVDKIAVDFSINVDCRHQHNASPVRWRAVAIVTAITIQTIIPAPICEIFGCIKHFKCMTIVIFRI